MDELSDDVPWSRDQDRRFERRIRRLSRLQLSDPAAVAAAHGSADSGFWGALAMGRHMHRFEQGAKHPELLPKSTYEGLLHIPRMDAVLTALGSVWSIVPDGHFGPTAWPAHLQWGADQFIDVSRHLRAGRPIAAVVLARHQLERWTLNIAHHHKIDPQDGEGSADFIGRAWAVYSWLEQDVGQVWSELSEYLHGRGLMADGQTWETASGEVRRASNVVAPTAIELHTRVANAANLAFSQVRAAVRGLALEAGHETWGDLMTNSFVISGDAEFPDWPGVQNMALRPLDTALAYSDWANEMVDVARGYRYLAARASRLDKLEEIENRQVVAAILERRVRAIERFRRGLEDEAEMVGEDFDPESLNARLFRYVAIAEVAEVLSSWTSDDEATSLRLAGGALRSAFYLWLEDTDQAMSCVRIVLEQTCQARTWRTKPVRAQRITESGRAASAPVRWIEAAGWRRASVLGKALGEFSHVTLRARWSGARRLLEEIQEPEVSSALERTYTARGNALTAAAYLLAFEEAERLEAVDPIMAAGFRESVTLLDGAEHLSLVESLLDRAYELRTFDFGEPDLTAAERAGSIHPGDNPTAM